MQVERFQKDQDGMYISGSDGSIEYLGEDQDDDMATIDDKPKPVGKLAVQGNSFDDGSFVNMQD